MLYLVSNHELSETVEEQCGSDTLEYTASGGTQVVTWWGDRHEDMSQFDDKYSLVYDTPPIKSDLVIMGFAHVSINVSSTSKLAFWNVRLEDVNPETGQVMLITGSNFNGAHRESDTNPSYIPINEYFVLNFDLHFTTWTFPKGHIIRVSISNSLFRSLWPSPYLMNTSISINDESSFITLPVFVDNGTDHDTPLFLNDTIVIAQRKDACKFEVNTTINYDDQQKVFHYIDQKNKATIVSTLWTQDYYLYVHDRTFYALANHSFTVNDSNPAQVSWKAHARQYFWFNQPIPGTNPDGICIGPAPKYLPSNPNSPSNDTLDLQSDVLVTSDADMFYVQFNRSVYRNGVFIKNKLFNQSYVRQFV